MSRISQLRAFALAILAVLAFVGVSEAGWVTIKNDTGKGIVVQEFIVVNGRKVGGKPYKLLPGESFREFQNTPGLKNYEVLDAANTNTTLLRTQLPCNNNTQAFSVTVVQGKVSVMPIPEPKKP